MSRIGYVINQKLIRNRRVVGIVANDPFFGALKIFERSAAYDFQLALGIARRNYDRSSRGNIPAAGVDDIRARLLSDERSVWINRRARTGNRPTRSEFIRRRSFRCE